MNLRFTTLALLLGAAAITAADHTGFDTDAAVGNFQCFKDNGYDFAIFRGYYSTDGTSKTIA